MAFKPTYVNLDAIEKDLLQQRARRPSNLDALLGGAQQGLELSQLPQKLQDQALARELQNALLQEKINNLRNPNDAFNRRLQQELALKSALNPDLGIQQAAPGLVGQTISNPGATSVTENSLDALLSANPSAPIPQAAAGKLETPIVGVGGVQTGFTSNPNIPDQAEDEKFNRDLQKTATARRSATALKFQRIGNDLVGLDPVTGKEVSRMTVDPYKKIMNTSKGLWVYDPENPSDGEYVPGSEKEDSGITPSQRLSNKRELRLTYQELPSKNDYFGRGQIPGSYQLKTRLDAVLKPVNGDFSKLNPQAKQTFVFAINKLRDPTSATLLAEAKQIADKAGIGDRFSSFIANWKEGDPLPDQVAKDIYEVISQVETAHKDALVNDLVQAKEDADELGVKLASIGVPKDLQDEVEKRLLNPVVDKKETTSPVVKKTSLSSNNDFPDEAAARAAGFENGDMVIIGGKKGYLE